MLRRQLNVALRGSSQAGRLSLVTGMRTFATKRYTADHEWVEVDEKAGVATVGISDYAQNALGDVVYVELPSKGAALKKKAPLGAVESVKAASDVYAPVAGTVLEVNGALENTPTLLNSSPEQDGWICKLKLAAGADAEIKSLMDAKAYKAHCEK